MEFLAFSQTKILGSSLALPANGLGGSRATKRKIKSPQKNRAKPEKQKGKKEGGWGEGIFALLRLRLERFRFPLIKRKPKQKIFHLLLKEKKWGQKKLKKCNGKISVLVCRSGAEASGNAPHYSGFCSKKVRISTKRYRKFTILSFLAELEAEQSSAEVALRAKKAEFARICHAERGKSLQNGALARFARLPRLGAPRQYLSKMLKL